MAWTVIHLGLPNSAAIAAIAAFAIFAALLEPALLAMPG